MSFSLRIRREYELLVMKLREASRLGKMIIKSQVRWNPVCLTSFVVAANSIGIGLMVSNDGWQLLSYILYIVKKIKSPIKKYLRTRIAHAPRRSV